MVITGFSVELSPSGTFSVAWLSRWNGESRRMAGVGKDLWSSSGPTPLRTAGCLGLWPDSFVTSPEMGAAQQNTWNYWKLPTHTSQSELPLRPGSNRVCDWHLVIL